MVYLLHVVQGYSYQNISDQLGIGAASAHRCVRECTMAILRYMQHDYIRLPTPQEAKYNMEQWRRDAGIPGIVGAIDGTHIAIRKPLVNGEDYYNSKGKYSINVQGMQFKTFVQDTN